MDVLDPREVMAHQNKVPNGPSSSRSRRRAPDLVEHGKDLGELTSVNGDW
jgi:hypothetical protein